METSLFFRFFAGIPMGETDTFPLIPLGCWLLPIGIYLLMMGSYLEMDRKNRYFVIIRYGRIKRWWRNYFFKHMLYGGLTAQLLLFLAELTEVIWAQGVLENAKDVFLIFVLWTTHGMMLLAIFLFLETTNIRKMIPSILILLEGITFLYGYRNKIAARFMFGTWGMYVQSNLCEGIYGFSLICVIAVQMILMMVCFLLGNHVLKKVRGV